MAVLELKDQQVIATLKAGPRFLGHDAIGPFPFNTRFILSGFLLEGASCVDERVGQNVLLQSTDALHFVPEVIFPEPAVDRFFLLEKEGVRLDGSMLSTSRMKGLIRGHGLILIGHSSHFDGRCRRTRDDPRDHLPTWKHRYCADQALNLRQNSLRHQT
ncbi:hypothetical protein [Novosphingobium sp. 11B]